MCDRAAALRGDAGMTHHDLVQPLLGIVDGADRVADLVAHAIQPVPHDLEARRFFSLAVVIQPRLGHAKGARDVADRGGVEAAVPEELRGSAADFRAASGKRGRQGAHDGHGRRLYLAVDVPSRRCYPPADRPVGREPRLPRLNLRYGKLESAAPRGYLRRGKPPKNSENESGTTAATGKAFLSADWSILRRELRMRTFVRILAGTALLALLPGVVAAQGTSTISGVVRDASGAVLPGVTVEAASPALIERVRSVTTDGSGQYAIVQLRPGLYSVTFTLPGFSVVKRENVELTADFTATINAELKVGALEETITVSAESPVVDVQSLTARTV